MCVVLIVLFLFVVDNYSVDNKKSKAALLLMVGLMDTAESKSLKLCFWLYVYTHT